MYSLSIGTTQQTRTAAKTSENPGSLDCVWSCRWCLSIAAFLQLCIVVWKNDIQSWSATADIHLRPTSSFTSTQMYKFVKMCAICRLGLKHSWRLMMSESKQKSRTIARSSYLACPARDWRASDNDSIWRGLSFVNYEKSQYTFSMSFRIPVLRAFRPSFATVPRRFASTDYGSVQSGQYRCSF